MRQCVRDSVDDRRHGGLEKATDIARSMAMRYGLAAQLGPVSYEHASAPLLGPTADAWQPRQYGEATAATIDLQVKSFIEEALQRARALLQKNRPILEETAERLLAQETLSAADLAQVRERLSTRERSPDKVAAAALNPA